MHAATLLHTPAVRRTFCRPRVLPILVLSLCLLGPAGYALTSGEACDAALAADRLRALKNVQEASAACELVKATATTRSAELDSASSTAKDDLAGLQKQLLSVLARDDAAAIQTTRALLAARQTELDANEAEKARLLKQADEAERDRDAWKRRAATLELVLRMDMKVLLAGPAEIEDREKRFDAADKDITSQLGQVQKYDTRMAATIADLENTRHRIAYLARSRSLAATPELQRAHDEEIRQSQRLELQQQAGFIFNSLLEERARRNLAFARTDYLVSRRFADALAHKDYLHRADDAQAAAERCEAQLAALRVALTVPQRTIATNLSLSTGLADAALQAVGEARTASAEEQAHAAYAAAQAHKNRWEAENECWKEYLSLQKAGSAFARECSDRARGVTESRTVADINQEEWQLRETLPTSEQYVRGFDLLLRKLDALVESARRDLGLSPETIADLTAPLAELFAAFDAAHPPSPELLADLQRDLATRLPAGDAASARDPGQRREIETALIARLMQREMLRTRKGISERWIEHSHAAIDALERQAGRLLWRQLDPRLNDTSCREAVALLGTVASHVRLIVNCGRARVGNVPDVAAGRDVLLASILVLLVWLASWAVSRAIRPGSGLRWLAARAISTLPPCVCAAWLALGHNATDPCLRSLGLYPLLVAAWLLVRLTCLACCPDRQRPAAATLPGGLLTAFDTLAVWTVALLPLHQLARIVENPWDTQAVIERVWLFGAVLVLIRLILHPTLMGRLLSRRSQHAGLRWLGTLTALACMLAAALAALPYLAGLDNLGRTVLHTVEASFMALIVALAGTTAFGWVLRRQAGKTVAGFAWVRSLQILIVLAAGASAVLLWWRLLNRVVFAPNAPPPVQQLVLAAGRALHLATRVWHANVTDGMTVSGLVRGLFVFVLSFWVSREAKRLFHKRVLARTTMDEATRATFSAILGYLIVLFGFLIGVNVAGSSLQNLALLAGAITVGVGFGLQNVINNFVSSLLIHCGRTIRVGDYIDVGGTRGTVREIGLRNTVLVTDDDITVLVPNGSFISANIINWTNPSRRIRLHVPVVVTRQADLAVVSELATSVASRHPLVIKSPAPALEVRAVTAAQVSMDLLAWTEKPEKLACIVGELSLALDRALRERGFAV